MPLQKIIRFCGFRTCTWPATRCPASLRTETLTSFSCQLCSILRRCRSSSAWVMLYPATKFTKFSRIWFFSFPLLPCPSSFHTSSSNSQFSTLSGCFLGVILTYFSRRFVLAPLCHADFCIRFCFEGRFDCLVKASQSCFR